MTTTSMFPCIWLPAYLPGCLSAGHEGNLCGACSDGWAKVRTLKCRPCQSPAAIITLYTLAAVAVLLAMKLVLAFSSRDIIGLSRHQLLPSQASLLGLAAAHAVLAAARGSSGQPAGQQAGNAAAGANGSSLQMSSSVSRAGMLQGAGSQPAANSSAAAAGSAAGPAPCQDPQALLSPTDIAKPFILYGQVRVGH